MESVGVAMPDVEYANMISDICVVFMMQQRELAFIQISRGQSDTRA